ncbi:MAG: hypothetical protein ACLTG4_06235 [Oscillospiraceae bacterium]
MRRNAQYRRRHRQKTGLMILEALEAGGKGSITVAVACSMAGMIAGCITVTGLASKLISGVVALSSKIPNPTLRCCWRCF